MNEWASDIDITTPQAIECIEQQWPELKPVSIQPFGEGWDNRVFLVNQEYIFRFPRRKVSVPLLKKENVLLPLVSEIPSIDTPDLTFIGEATTTFPYPFQGVRHISGKPGYQASLTHQQRVESIVPLAKFLKSLHNLKLSDKTKKAIGRLTFDKLDIQERQNNIVNRVNKIHSLGIARIDEKRLRDIFDQTPTLQPLETNHCLIHGDLYCRHIYYKNGKLSGIIDWGDAEIYHPVIDLSIIHSFFPVEAHQDFFKHYGTVSSSVWAYARFLGLYSAISFLLYGACEKKDDLVKESIDTINRIDANLLLSPNTNA